MFLTKFAFTYLVLLYLIKLTKSDELIEEYLVLDESNIDQTIQQNKNLLVIVYIPWSPFWLANKNNFKNYNEFIKTKDLNVKVGIINLAQYPMLADKFRITNIPSLLLITNEEPSKYLEYKGEFEIGFVFDWVKRNIEKPLTLVENVGQIENLKK